MKLRIIRHADPDYSIDSLTPVGWEEARLLAERVAGWDVKAFYVSPLGRAQATLKPTLEKTGRTAEVKEWLREFPPQVKKPGEEHSDCAWDWLPADWTGEAAFYDRTRWTEVPCFAEVGMKDAYRRVTDGLDELLGEHGYRREGDYYRVERANEDTVVLVCHFGLECVLLSHLIGATPMVLWHGLCAAPSSVTTIYTEERRRGIASFRIASFGDVSHLLAAGREPSFSARFCETYDNFEQRHD